MVNNGKLLKLFGDTVYRLQYHPWATEATLCVLHHQSTNQYLCKEFLQPDVKQSGNNTCPIRQYLANQI